MFRLLSAAAVLCAFAAPALAQAPLPLSKILTTAEEGGTRTVVSAERGRHGWEVVSCPLVGPICREDRIDARSGAVVRSEREGRESTPPIGARPASAVAAQIEALKIGAIAELEFDDRVWEVKVRDGRRKAELKLDPMTGATQRCKGSLCPR